MKSCIAFMVLLLAHQITFAAEMLYRQGFETPIQNNPEIQWTSPGYPLSQKVVEHQPKEGSKSVRGNFNPKVRDPIIDLNGDAFPQFKINFKGIPAIKEWYKTTDKIYVSWWFKLDKCHWKGPSYANTDPLRTTGKFAFLRMNEDPATSYYFTMNGGELREAALSANKWNDLWEQKYGRPSLWLSNKTADPWGADGKWHKLSFFIGKKESGEKYIMWWIDDSLMQADRFELDGKHSIYSGFILDSIQFWHSFTGNTDDSTPVDGGICNGWQIDDVSIWNDIPEKPVPPTRRAN